MAPLKDPIDESRRLIAAANARSLTVRLLGGAAIYLQAPAEGPLLPRPVGDIDITTRRGNRAGVTQVLTEAGYQPDEMFNALHGSKRLLFYDEVNGRKLDVFVGEFTMCHPIPIAERLERHPLTVPLAELMLTKLQIVELTERDQKDIYNLSYHHHVSSGDGTGIEGDYIAEICSRDWGLWRTARTTIERCKTNLPGYVLDPSAADLIVERLDLLWARIEEAPKTTRWRLRSRVGDRVRWYEEPEEHGGTN